MTLIAYLMAAAVLVSLVVTIVCIRDAIDQNTRTISR